MPPKEPAPGRDQPADQGIENMTQNQNEIILHIGAHRTGTTSFQRYLSSNRGMFSQNGISIFTPEEAREQPCESWKFPMNPVIVSEENILGTMEDNIGNARLYPHAMANLARLKAIAPRISRVLLSIREPTEWWSSAISFCAARGMLKHLTLPDKEKIIAGGSSWSETVNAIRECFPHATVIVREFNWHPSNPRWQLRNVASWDFLSSSSVNCAVNNSRPAKEQVMAGLLENGTGIAKNASLDGESVRFFSDTEKADLRERYISDVENIAVMDDVIYLGERRERLSRILANEPSRQPSYQMAPRNAAETTCFIHVGKTGGSYLKSLAKNARTDNNHRHLVLGDHSLTVANSSEKYGSERKLAFFFRDPIERYVSGFLSRMRQGRPVYDVNWTAAEAVSYLYFKTPNELAEALSSRSARLVSAAKFAFSSIVHLKLDGAYYFQSVERLRREASMGNIVICCETRNIDNHIARICDQLNIPAPKEKGLGEFDDSKNDFSQLSTRAKKNLEKYLENDYRLYDVCREISLKIGFC